MVNKMTLKKQDWLFIIPLVILAGALLVLHNYNDFLITTRQGINLWKILFEGRLLYFYQDNTIISGNQYYSDLQGCAYSIAVYLIFAVWNIPLAFLIRFTNIDVMNNMFCLAWAKLLMFAALGLTAYLMNRLMLQLEIPAKQRKLGLYLYLSSALVCSSVYLIGGYDVLGLVFQLLGLLAYLRRDNRKFIFYFGVATCFKFFALITFAPLVLLRWKRIDKILLRLLGAVIPYCLIALPFKLVSLGQLSLGSELAAGLLKYIFLADFPTRGLFYVGIIVLLFWCFCTDIDLPQNGVWSAMAANILVFAFLQSYPYWVVHIVPYLILGIMLTPNLTEPLLYLELAGSGALMLKNIYFYTWCYKKYNTLVSGLLGPLMNHDSDADFFSLVVHACAFLWNKGITPMVIVACFGMLCFLTFPVFSLKFQRKIQYHDLRVVCGLRFFVNAGICLLPAACLILEIVLKR